MTNPPVIYVECDVPEGMTLAAWRSANAPARSRARHLLRRLTRHHRRRGLHGSAGA